MFEQDIDQRLEQGVFYTTDESDLVVFILSIKLRGICCIVADTLLFKKNTGALIEARTEHTLISEKIEHWKEYKKPIEEESDYVT